MTTTKKAYTKPTVKLLKLTSCYGLRQAEAVWVIARLLISRNFVGLPSGYVL